MKLWTARHGTPIAAVFATEDGGAVVSVDESSHARLWPALDGSREPVVLPLAMPRAVVVVRDGDGFAVAGVDVSGGLEILAIDAAGKLVARTKREPEPGVADVVTHDGGFLVLHRDQMLELLDLRGARRASLVAAPGEHVVKLLARNRRTLAIARTREGVRGHWLATDKLAWSEQTPKLTLDLSRVWLSPNHRRLLTFVEARGEAMLVDLDTGRARSFASNLDGDGSPGLPVGFSGDNKVLFAMNDFELSTLEWWTLAGRKVAVLGGTSYALDLVSVDAPVVTDTNVIMFSGHELAVARPHDARNPSEVAFLGYRTSRAKGLRSSPLGVVASIGSTVALLDANAHVGRRVSALQMMPLAKDLALVQFVTTKQRADAGLATIDPEWIEGTPNRPRAKQVKARLALVDLEQGKDLHQWAPPGAFSFEPASQLLAIDRGSKVELAQFDPVARTFGASRSVPGWTTRIALLDPALTDGVTAMLIRETTRAAEVRMVSGSHATPPRTFAGLLEAVDRAGRLYLREDDDTIVVVRDGHEPARLAIQAGAKLRPSPTGNQIATFARSRLALLDASGATIWSVGFPGVTDAAWTPSGELFVLAGDIARLDVTNGSVVAAQCGWGFALRTHRPEAVDFPSTSETTCDH